MANKSKTTVEGVKVNGRGYAIGVGCTKNHGGNTGLVHHSRGFFACQGCGEFVGSTTVADRQSPAEQAHGLTLDEWMYVAGITTTAQHYDVRAAWRAGEDPDSYRDMAV
jgi:hypothetical protein